MHFGIRALAAIGLLTVGLLSPALADKRVALVIGNSAYRNVPALQNPVNDASDVAIALERLGFSVRKISNATYDDIRRGLLDFGRHAYNADMAVVFFAGHGLEVGGENWLVPVDAELRSDVDVEQEAISLRNLMPALGGANKLGLVILDACRNNPFATRMTRTSRPRTTHPGLASVDPSGNVLVAFAAKDGTTAADGLGRNSPFTTSLLKHIEVPGLEINFLFRNVRDDVIRTTAGRQQPFIYGSLSSAAIYLKEPPVQLEARPDVQRISASEEMAWTLLKDTSDPAALQRFVDQYPASIYRAEAEQRIVYLNTIRKAEVRPEPAVAVVEGTPSIKAQLAALRTEEAAPPKAPATQQTAVAAVQPRHQPRDRAPVAGDVTRFDGSWSTRFTSSCGFAKPGHFSIRNGRVSNHQGGGRVSSDGAVSGRLIVLGMVPAHFSGKLHTTSSGGGSWRNSLGCYGRWSATRNG